MKLEHFGMAEPGDCRVVFSAAAEELEAAVQAEKAAPDAPQNEDDLLTAAVNRAILEGFSPLFAQLMKENDLQPVTDPDFELLAVNRAEGFRAGAEFYCLPPLELERYTGFTPPIPPRPIRQVSIEVEVYTRHGDVDRAADAAGKAALRQQGVVVALLHDVAVLHHKDKVCLPDGGKAVRHDEAGASLHHAGKGLLDAYLSAGINGGGGFVQNQHGRQADRRAGDAEQQLLNQTDDAAVAVAVAADFVFLRFWKILIPAGCRVVVMCSGVADAVGCCKIVRMIITLIQSLKSKLKDLHTRESKLITQFLHFRSDHTKIFCPDRKILAELFLDSLEQFFARAFFPFTIYSSLFISRYGPVSFEAAEMVDTQVVSQIHLHFDTVDPPGIAVSFMVFPVVERIAPELSG